jgi:hypothetical protein
VKTDVQLVSPKRNIKERTVNNDDGLFIVWSFRVIANRLAVSVSTIFITDIDEGNQYLDYHEFVFGKRDSAF